jgi:hypothetical protein
MMSIRVVIVGMAMVAFALAFFISMAMIASKSNDSVALMQTVGTVSGIVGTLGIVMAIIGALGKRSGRRPRP